MMDEDKRKQKVATVLKWIGGLGAAALISPVIFFAVKGLVGLAIAGGVGLVLIKLTPWASMKLSNMAVRLMLNEAKRNPIETLINLQVEKTKELEALEEAVTEFDAEVMSYDGKLDGYAKKYPDKVKLYREISRKMHLLLDQQRRELGEANQQLLVLQDAIGEARDTYDMALAAAKVQQLSGKAQEKVFQKIKEQVAFDSVSKSVYKAFAAVNTSLAKRQELTAEASPAALEAVPIDVEAVTLDERSKIPVRRNP